MKKNMLDEIVPTDENEKRSLELMQLVNAMKGESDRGLVITSASHIELYLERILRAFLIDGKDTNEMFDGPYAPLGSFSAKIKTSLVLGLISKNEASKFEAVRKVRNVFAHDLTASFKHQKVKKLCAKQPINNGQMCDRDAFLHLAMNAAISIVYRDYGVEKELKRKPFSAETRHLLDRAGRAKKLK